MLRPKSKYDETELILAYLEAKTSGRPITQICKEHGLSAETMALWTSRWNSGINVTKRLRKNFLSLRLQIESQKQLLRKFGAPSKN
jgi:transposase-like protein